AVRGFGAVASAAERRSASAMALPLTWPKAAARRFGCAVANAARKALRRGVKSTPRPPGTMLETPPLPMEYWETLSPTWKKFVPDSVIDIEIWLLLLAASTRSARR